MDGAYQNHGSLNRGEQPRLRVLQIASSISPEDGGPSTAILELSEALARRGAKVRLLTTDYDPSGRLDIEVNRWIRRSGALIRCHRVRWPRSIKLSPALAVSPIRLAKRSDVIHSHGLYLFHNIVVLVASRVWKTPYVVHPHGVLEPYQRGTHRVRKSIWDTLIGRVYLQGASAVTYASDSERRHAWDIVPREKSHVVSLGAVSPRASLLQPTATKWWRKDLENQQVVLFLGRLAKKKRVDLLIEAWPSIKAESPNAKLIIVGPDPDRIVPSLMARSTELGLTGSVEFWPPVTGADKWSLLRFAEVFVLPSENENFAIAVAEALGSGTPVVVSSEVAISSIIAESGAGVVLTHLTRHHISQSIESVLRDNSRRHCMSIAAAELATTWFSWDAAAARLHTVLASAASGSSGEKSGEWNS